MSSVQLTSPRKGADSLFCTQLYFSIFVLTDLPIENENEDIPDPAVKSLLLLVRGITAA